MRQRAVPATFDEFVTHYQKYILWVINKVSRGRVHEQDVPDLLQAIYLRVWEKGVLDRVRNRPNGELTTYLYFVCKSVCINQFAKNSRNPLNTACPIRANIRKREDHGSSYGVDVEGPSMVESLSDTQFEQRVLTDVMLDQFERFVETTKRGARLSKTLRMLYEGHSGPEIMRAHKLSRSNVSAARKELRAHFDEQFKQAV